MIYAGRPLMLRWLQVGKKEGATHMLLVQDAMADETLPVYVAANENLRHKVSRFEDGHSMKLLAVFSLRSDLEQQLDNVIRKYGIR